jgi:parallel beta-helix repeat protein
MLFGLPAKSQLSGALYDACVRVNKVGLTGTPLEQGGTLKMLQEKARSWRQWSLLALTVGLAIALSMAVAGEADAQQKAELVVPRDYPKIQKAVDAAEPGSTIRVLKGVYKEEVVIDDDLTIKGEGAGATTIKAPRKLTKVTKDFATHLPDGFRLSAVMRITDGAHVNLSGVTVAGPIPCKMEFSGIQVLKNATLNLSDSRVTRLRAEGCASPPEAKGRGVVYGLPPHIETDDGERGSTAHGTVTNVAVDRYRAAGITVTGPSVAPPDNPDGFPSTATISHNTITGGADFPILGQSGIQVVAGAKARVKGNTISSNVCIDPRVPSLCGRDPINQAQSTGIFVLSGEPGTEISQNRVSDNDVGVYLGVYLEPSPNCCTISENILQNNRFFGIVIQDGDGTTSHNTIRGGEVGIGVVADLVDTVGVLRGDEISGTSVQPIQEIECCGFEATAQVEKD